MTREGNEKMKAKRKKPGKVRGMPGGFRLPMPGMGHPGLAKKRKEREEAARNAPSEVSTEIAQTKEIVKAPRRRAATRRRRKKTMLTEMNEEDAPPKPKPTVK